MSGGACSICGKPASATPWIGSPRWAWSTRRGSQASRARGQVNALAAAFWPGGKLTMILPRGEKIPDLVVSGLGTVAVRAPWHPVAQDLLARCGVPLAAPSANRFGRISPTTAAHVAAELGDRIELILDGGPCEVVVGVDDRRGRRGWWADASAPGDHLSEPDRRGDRGRGAAWSRRSGERTVGAGDAGEPLCAAQAAEIDHGDPSLFAPSADRVARVLRRGGDTRR